MKAHLHIVILCLTSIAFSQQQKTNQITSLNVATTFGRLGADCSGRGLCSFKRTEKMEDINSIVTYNKDDTITFIIDRSKITKEDEVKITGQQLSQDYKVSDLPFILEDNFNLGTEIKSRLKTPLQYTKIQKGSYPLSITKNTFTIIFKLD